LSPGADQIKVTFLAQNFKRSHNINSRSVAGDAMVISALLPVASISGILAVSVVMGDTDDE